MSTLLFYLFFSSTHYTMRGGLSSVGAYCGAFCIYTSTGFSWANWYYGATLSFKPSTHYTQRGGASLLSAYCGIFLVDAGDTASYAYWIAGAALE